MADNPGRPEQVTPQKISVSDSNNAPIIFFDGASNFGNFNGIVNVTLAASRHLMTDGQVTSDAVAVAFLRCTSHVAIELRNALDQALLLGAKAQGQA
jgi:hypothetical protein